MSRICQRAVSHELRRGSEEGGSEAPSAEPGFRMKMPRGGRLFLATCLGSLFVLVLYFQSITKPGKPTHIYSTHWGNSATLTLLGYYLTNIFLKMYLNTANKTVFDILCGYHKEGESRGSALY